MREPAFILVSGAKRAGKSTLLEHLSEQARHDRLSLGGIVARSVWTEDGHKQGIEALDIGALETRTLATIVRNGQETTVGEYRFHQNSSAWALECMRRALTSPLDVAIIDEIGRLELVKGEGYASLLPMLSKATARVILLVVRSNYVDSLINQTHIKPRLRVNVTVENRDALIDTTYNSILELL